MDIRQFLLENDVTLFCSDTNRHMTADEAYELGGEFIVYKHGNSKDIYRGDDFDEAVKYLTNTKHPSVTL